MAEAPLDDAKGRRSRVGEVARLFLKLGFTAFGGPAAHVALMEDEVVHRRGWVDRRHFLDMVSAVNFVPGPNSTELAIHVGWERAGFRGLVAAGVCFIVPAVLIILPIAAFYVAYGRTPRVEDALAGVKACMVAIVIVAMVRFARAGVRDGFTGGVAVCALAAAVVMKWYGVPQQELIVLAGAAVAGAGWYGRRGGDGGGPATGDQGQEANVQRSTSNIEHPTSNIEHRSGEGAGAVVVPVAAAGVAGVSGQMVQMALFFLKVGATLFGSGYVLASFLRTGLVEQHGWLSDRELLDAIAVGQVTPGPLLTAATFIGYVLGARTFGGGMAGGVVGAVVATGAIFLPSFLFISVLGPLLPRIRNNRWARGALDGMNAAVVSLIGVVTVWLGQAAVWPEGRVSWMGVGVLVVSLGVLLWTKVNATWLIVAAGVVGVVGRGVG